MSSLAQMGVSPPGWRLQKHHTQKHSFRSHGMHRHPETQFTISCIVSQKHAQPTEAHTFPTFTALVNRHSQGSCRNDPCMHPRQTDTGVNSCI